MNEQLKEAVSEAIREALGGALDCGRVWSAWGVGTMSEDDFSPVADDAERVAELTDAVLDALVATGRQRRSWWHSDMWHPRRLEDAIEQMSDMREDWAEMGRRLGFDSYTDLEPLLARASELAEQQRDARVTVRVEGVGQCTLTVTDGGIDIPASTFAALATTGKQQVGGLTQRPAAPHAANNAPSPTVRMQVGEVQG